MREIKFRAWEEINKVMHFDFRFIKSGNEGNDWLIFTSDKQTLKDSHHPFDNPWFQQQFKVMQYTGLKDANGVEIYEGDIVRVWNGNKTIIGHDGFQFCIGKKQRPMKAHEASKMKVLGNICQNKELLNG